MNEQICSNLEKRGRVICWVGVRLTKAVFGMAGVILGIGAFGSVANAAVDIGVNQNFIPVAPHSSATPWVNLLFSDIGPNTVQLTITAPNLTGSEYLSSLRLNFNSTKDVTALNFTPVYSMWNGVSTGSSAWDMAAGQDKFKASKSGGQYDMNLNFDGPKLFNGGDQVVFNITTSQKGTGLSSQDFAFLSNNYGGNSGVFYAAANIFGISPGSQNGWDGANSFTVLGVPEPASGFAAAAVGLVGMLRLRKTRQVVSKAIV